MATIRKRLGKWQVQIRRKIIQTSLKHSQRNPQS